MKKLEIPKKRKRKHITESQNSAFDTLHRKFQKRKMKDNRKQEERIERNKKLFEEFNLEKEARALADAES